MTDLISACKRLGLVPNIGLLDKDGRALARKTLGDALAIAVLGPRHMVDQAGPGIDALGAETLMVLWGPAGALLGPILTGKVGSIVIADPTPDGILLGKVGAGAAGYRASRTE